MRTVGDLASASYPSCSTLESALSFLAESFDRVAQEHLSYSEVLNVQVADELRSLERKKEETRKKVLLSIRSNWHCIR